MVRVRMKPDVHLCALFAGAGVFEDQARLNHSVSVQTHQSGAEVRTSYWDEPLSEFDLTYEFM